MTEQDAAKLAAIPLPMADFRKAVSAFYCNETNSDPLLDAYALILNALDEANERARQMREAIVELTTFHKKSEMGTWMERSKAAWERIEAIAASSPSGESALRKAARYEAALREIADVETDCTSRTCDFYPGIPRYEDCSKSACRVSGLAAAALEDGGGP